MNQSTINEQFYQWLSTRASSNTLSNLYNRVDDIDTFCKKIGILNDSLIGTVDIETISKIKDVVSRNRVFKFRHKKNIRDYIDITNRYYDFIKNYYIDEENKNNSDSSTAENVSITQNETNNDIELDTNEHSKCDASILNNTKIVDFNNVGDYIATRPLYFEYFGEKYESEKHKWQSLFTKAISLLYEDYSSRFESLIGVRIANCGRTDLAKLSNDLVCPFKLSENLFLETFQSNRDYIVKLKEILDICLVDYENVVIAYEKETSNSVSNHNGLDISETSFDEPHRITISQAISVVLGNTCVPMSVKDIYNSIVEKHLYVFGAQNPVHVVEVTINRACRGNNYSKSNHASTPLFGFIEENGTKKYFLLSKEEIVFNDREKTTYDSKIQKKETKIDTKDSNQEKYIIKEFIVWMCNEKHISKSTARLYASSITWCEKFMIIHQCGTGRLFLATQEEAKTNIEMLLKNQEFVNENSKQRYRYFASLKKLIEYMGLGNIIFPMKNKPSTNESVSLSKTSKNQQTTEYNSETINNVTTVLEKHYKYGFKRDSIREILRFRQFADSLCLSIPDNDEQLLEVIEFVGEIIDDKIYYKKSNFTDELSDLVESAFEQGVKVIYYESFYTINADWMEENFIASESVLKEYLEKAVTNCSFSKKFMTNGIKETEKTAITEEIKRVWGNKQILEVGELSKKLPYIPLNNIWRVISGNDNFVLAYEGAYLNIDYLIISQTEIDIIVKYVNNACYEKGFVSLLEIPIESIEEENYDVPKSAIFRAVYNIALSDKYHLNGKILTKDKPNLDAVSLLKQHIKEKDVCTFEEASEILIDLTSISNRQYVFQALYDEMIRVDKNRFVSNDNVHYSVDDIDMELSSFMSNHFCSIQDITTFAMFPVCGQTWNHYLLESFCYKYSKKYSLHIKNFNDKNAGIIAEKDYLENYDEMLAIVIAKSDVELTVEAIGQYLYENGYMAKRKYANYPNIIQRALDLRKTR